MTTRTELIAEARSWIGTRFAHQGQTKGREVDCDNFIKGVADRTGITLVHWENNYRRREDGSVMLQMLGENLDLVGDSIEEAQRGDIIAFKRTGEDKPSHVAFLTETKETSHSFYIVHAREPVVAEHRINNFWIKSIHSIWRIRGIVD